KVWACVDPGYALPLLVFQRVAPGRVGTRVLERIVAGARPAARAVAPGGRYELPSSSDVLHMSRRFASPLYLPPHVPRGFLFSEWRFSRHGDDGRRVVEVMFGRDGLVLAWDVMVGVDRSGFDCPQTKTTFPPKPFAVVNGVTTFLNVGIHG